MKLRYFAIACFCITVALSLFGCSNYANAGRATTPEPTPTATISKDEAGNSTNPDGWTIPPLTSKSKVKSTRAEKYEDGTPVTVTVISYRPEQRVVADLPPHGGDRAWMITQVAELSVADLRPFCYVYDASPFENGGLGNGVGVTTRYRICDMDGDGKFELKRSGSGIFFVPGWAK